MTPHELAQELLILASEDEHAAEVLEESGTVADSIIGFHYQQAGEKLLKAVLASRNVDYPRTHNLSQLLMLTMDRADYPPVLEEDLAQLTPFAVLARYPALPGTPHLDLPRAKAAIRALREWATALVSPREQ